ncbi:MAG: type II toxin-antitoxin system CcdA family antitoxin [Alphaproteobacteria bacterium]|nr:type II toxin-antitoxin system CcdA family antitoxin [Alphaproteobacteria bacterium]MBF0394725.1 type II toxin-antitoxin system CcdA family antitoxin [Alphaproteobacteria bacterium]
MRRNMEELMRGRAASAFLQTGAVAKKATNLSLSQTLVNEAKSLGINLSRACERGLAEEIADARAAQWREENHAAIESYNDYIETHGLPLARFRQF